MRHHLVSLLRVTSSCLMGLAGLLVPAGYVYSLETNRSCNAKGYVLRGDGHCGSQTCGARQPGYTFCSQGTGHPSERYL